MVITKSGCQTGTKKDDMSDETVVLNDISRYGMRRVHVMRMGKPVEREQYICNMLPVEYDLDDLILAEYRDAAVDVYHLWLHWHAREMVTLRYGDGRRSEVSCWWWMGKMNVRLAADCAATVYRRKMGRWPDRVLISKLPKWAEGHINAMDMGEAVQLQLVAEEWVPEKFVVVV